MSYNVSPGTPGIILSFKVWDELPLFQAKIFPAEDQDRIWACLQSADPIFTREMPNTEAAIRFYSTNIKRCLQNVGRSRDYAAATVTCDIKGKASEIVFNIREK